MAPYSIDNHNITDSEIDRKQENVIAKAIEITKKNYPQNRITLEDVYDVCLEIGGGLSDVDIVINALRKDGLIVRDIGEETQKIPKQHPTTKERVPSKNNVILSAKSINPESSPEQRVVYNLLILYDKKGFVTENDIFEECDKADLSFSRIDYVGKQILAYGVLISNEIVNEFSSDSMDDDSDILVDIPDLLSDIDVSRKIVYDFFLKKYPEMENIIISSANSTPLSERDIKRLLPQIRSGNEKVREYVIASLVIKALIFSLYYRGITTLPLNEVFSEAILGIIEAIDLYDQYSDYSLNKQLKDYMRKNVEQYIADNESLIKKSLDLRGRIKAKQDMSNHHYLYQYDNNISDEVIIEAINEYCTTENSKRNSVQNEIDSIERIIDDNSGLLVYYPDYRCLDLDDLFDKEELSFIVNQIISTLTPREQLVIKLRYGIDSDSPKTLEEVGRILSVTRERVRQIEAKILRKLKHPSRQKLLYGYYSKKKNK